MAAGFMAGSIVSKMVLDTDKWNASIKAIKKDENSLSNMTKRLAPKFKQIGMGMTIAGAAIVAGLGAGVRAFSKFDLAMTESLAIMGDVSEEMQTNMKNAALEMSGKSKFAADELAESYFFLASAGIDAAGAIKALPVVTRFAQAGAFDLARATDLLTDAQSALGLSSKDAVKNQQGMVRVSDVLVKANTLANASVSQFSEALTNRAGPSMRAYGVELESGVAVLAAFADQGIKGSEAGMQYAIVLRDLQKSAMENKGAFEAAGIAVFDANGNLNNMGDIIGQLEIRLSGMSAEQKKAELATLGFQERSQAALLTLVGTSEKIKEYETNLRSAAGVTQEVSDKQLQSFSAQMTIAKNQVTAAGIAIGEQLAPTIVDVAKKISGLVAKVTEWARENPKLFSTIVKVVGGLGAMLTVFGPIVMMIPRLVSGFSLLSKGIIKMGLSFKTSGGQALSFGKALKTPIGAMSKGGVAAAVLGAAIAGWQIGKAIGKIELFGKSINEHIVGGFEKAIDVMGLWEGATVSAEDKAKSLDKTQRRLAEASKIAGREITNITEANKIYWGSLKETTPGIKDFSAEMVVATEAAGKLGTKLDKNTIAAIMRLKQEWADLDAELKDGNITLDEYREKAAELDSQIKSLTTGINEQADAIKTVTTLTDTLVPATSSLVVQVNNWKVEVIDFVSVMEGAQDTLKDFYAEAVPAARDFSDVLALAPPEMEDIEAAAFEIKKTVPPIWDSITDGLVTKWSSMIGEVLRGSTSLKDGLKGIWDAMKTQFTDIIGQMISKFMTDFVGGILSGATNAASGLLDKLGGAISGLLGGSGGGAGGVASGVTNLMTGGIASAVGAGVGAIIGSLLAGSGSDRNIELIKDHTWLAANVLKINVVKNLDAIKWGIWNLLDVFKQDSGGGGDVGLGLDGVNKKLINTNNILRSINANANAMVKALRGIKKMQHGGVVKSPTLAVVAEAGPEAVIPLDKAGGFESFQGIVDKPPVSTRTNQPGQSQAGTVINIRRIQEIININGTIISDREYVRQRLLPEIMEAMKQRTTKKRLQEIVGIA